MWSYLTERRPVVAALLQEDKRGKSKKKAHKKGWCPHTSCEGFSARYVAEFRLPWSSQLALSNIPCSLPLSYCLTKIHSSSLVPFYCSSIHLHSPWKGQLWSRPIWCRYSSGPASASLPGFHLTWTTCFRSNPRSHYLTTSAYSFHKQLMVTYKIPVNDNTQQWYDSNYFECFYECLSLVASSCQRHCV